MFSSADVMDTLMFKSVDEIVNLMCQSRLDFHSLSGGLLATVNLAHLIVTGGRRQYLSYI